MAITSSMSRIAMSRPSTRWRRSSHLPSRNRLRRVVTSRRWSTKTRRICLRPITCGCPPTRATALIEKESSSGVRWYSCWRTASGLKPFFTSMTRRSPWMRSVRFCTDEIPLRRPAPTFSLIFSMTFSGPTM